MNEDPTQTENQKPSLAPWVVLILCTLLFALKPVLLPPKLQEGFD